MLLVLTNIHWLGISLVLVGVIWVSVQEYINNRPVEVTMKYVPLTLSEQYDTVLKYDIYNDN